MGNLDGKVVLVVGAAGALGDAVARELAAQGAGVHAVPVEAAATFSGGRQAVGQCIERFGRIDHVANCGQAAGEDFDRVVAAVLKASFTATQAFIQWVRGQPPEAQGGSVVFTSSLAGLWGQAGQPVQSAAGAGIFGLQRVLTKECLKHNIRFNTVIPEGDPDAAAPMVAYLLTDHARDLNDMVVGVAGSRLSRYVHPAAKHVVYREDAWTVADLGRHLRALMGQESTGTATLRGRVAVVTGSGRGIGQATVKEMARLGARVVVNDVDEEVVWETVHAIREGGGEATGCIVGVGSDAAGEQLVQAALQAFGRLDILVNNAGILRDRMSWNMTEEEWDAVIHVHLRGTWACSQAAVPVLKKHRYGRIVNITSTSGLLGNTGQANYGAAKTGIAGIARTLALELAPYNVTVNAISPGARTRMTLSVPDRARQIRAEQGIAPPPAQSRFRLGEPEDVACAIAYLCSDEAADITGRIVGINGAQLALWHQHLRLRTATHFGRWEVDDLVDRFKRTAGYPI